MISLGGLWVNKSKDGVSYMSGAFGPFARMLIFKNNKKQKDSDPDYMVCIAENKPREQNQEQQEDVSFP